MDMKIHHCKTSSENVLIMHRGKEVRSTQVDLIKQFKETPYSYFTTLYTFKKPQQ